MMRANVRDRIRAEVAESRRPKAEAGVSTVVVHVDMDAFFAAIEERDNPSLQGRPVVVGGPKGSRGVITTANYVARRYGVHAGMSLAEADRRCPDAVHVSTRGGKYTWVSLELMAILRRFSPKVEPYSIDEAFLDATGCLHLYGDAWGYGRAIKAAIRHDMRLTASVGVGPSRVVAKIASGLEKPDGLTVIEPHRVAEVLGPLPVRDIPGVGPSTGKALESLHLYTINDLVNCPESLLQRALGRNGRELQRMMKGSGGSHVTAMEERPEDKSMGHEHTFHRDISEESVLLGRLLYLCERATRRMRKQGYLGRIVTLKLRTFDFRTRDHQRKLSEWTDDPSVVFDVAKGLFRELWRPGDKPVRLIGVSVSGLLRPSELLGAQSDLFTAERREKRQRLFLAVDRVKDAYGEKVLGLAGGMDELR